MCESNEVVLFEKATFLVISHGTVNQDKEEDPMQYWCFKDPHRFEKISNIIKQFKLSCLKFNSQFQSILIRNSHFHAYIDEFTANTYLMVVLADSTMQPAAISLNIKLARQHFEPLISS